MEELNSVVIGGLHHNTLGVIRSLGEAGISKNNINVLIIGKDVPQSNIISKSKYILRSKISYIEKYEEITPWLLDLSNDDKMRVVICCADGAAEEVVKHNDKLTPLYKTPKTNIDISILMNKEEQGKIAKVCGLIVPQSIVYSKGNTIFWSYFPCIIKPIKSIDGAGKNDIHIANNEIELKQAIETTQAKQVQIQQYITKQMEYQLIGCSLNHGEKIIIPGYTRIERQPENTNTGYLEYRPIDTLKFDTVAVTNFIKHIGYSGLFSIEFIRDINGTDFFLEINMRNDGNGYCVQSAGVNLPYIWSYYELYGKVPDVNMSINRSIWFIPDFNDLKVARKSVGVFRWIKDFIRADSHSIYNKKDIRPFMCELRRLVKKIFWR